MTWYHLHVKHVVRPTGCPHTEPILISDRWSKSWDAKSSKKETWALGSDTTWGQCFKWRAESVNWEHSWLTCKIHPGFGVCCGRSLWLNAGQISYPQRLHYDNYHQKQEGSCVTNKKHLKLILEESATTSPRRSRCFGCSSSVMAFSLN